MEVLGLVGHACPLQARAEHLHIVGIEHPGVFGYLAVVGIGLKLCRLMTDDGHGGEGASLLQIHLGVGVRGVEQSAPEDIGIGEGAAGVGIGGAPCLAAHAAGGEIVHAGFHTLIAQIVVGPEGEELVGCQPAEVGHKLTHFLYRAPEFIAQGEHHERGVVAILTHDVLALLVQEGHEALVGRVEVTPEGQFRLQVDAQAVGGLEGGLGRAPGVEAQVVDAILLVFEQIGRPLVNPHGHMGGERKHAGIVLAAQEGAVAVHAEVHALGTEVGQSEGHRHLVAPVGLGREHIAVRGELVPQRFLAFQREDGGVGCRWGLLGRVGVEFRGPQLSFSRPRGLRGNQPVFRLGTGGEFHPCVFPHLAPQGEGHFHLPVLHIGPHLQVGDMELRPCRERHLADDAVPVGLRVFGAGMRVAEQLGRQRRAVVDHNGYGVPSGGEPRGEVIALRSADIVALTGQVAVYVHLGGFGALQGELDALLLPLFRDDHLAAVPGTAHIARHTGQVGSLLTGGRGVALAVGVDGAGQHHVVAVDHLLHGQALLISGKLPFTAQVYAARGSGILCLGHKGSCHQA